MSKDERTLTTGNPTVAFSVNFNASKVYIANPTGSPVYLKIGTPQAPRNANEADAIIPAGSEKTVPALGQVFAASFADSSLLTNTVAGNLGAIATIVVMSADEVTPTFGALSYQSISVSMLSNGIEAISPTARIYDLGPWGGAIIFLAPDGGSGQTWIDLTISQDGITWRTAQIYAMWPGVPVTVNVPRIARFLQLQFFATGIPAEPNPSGFFFVRGSLTEITQYVYKPLGNAITKSYTLGAFGSQQWQLFAAGIPSISIADIATAGTGASSAITLLIEGSSDRINWRRITFRTQAMSTGVTLFRSIGNLDLYLRVTVFEVGGAAANGTLYISIMPESDSAYLLNSILGALGDQNAPSNTNQDIYHVLLSALTSLQGIDSDTNNLAGMATSLTNIDTDTNNLSLIHTDLATTIANLITATNTLLNTISTLDSAISTNTGNDASNTASLIARRDTQVSPGAFTFPLANTWYFSGTSVQANRRITHIEVGMYNVAGAGAAIIVGIGTAGAVQFQICQAAIADGLTVNFDFTARMDDGYPVFNNPAIWLQTTAPAGSIASFTVHYI